MATVTVAKEGGHMDSQSDRGPGDFRQPDAPADWREADKGALRRPFAKQELKRAFGEGPTVGSTLRWWIRHPLALLLFLIPFVLALALSQLLGAAFADLIRWPASAGFVKVVKWIAIGLIAVLGSIVALWCLAVWAAHAVAVNSDRRPLPQTD
ncbi:MAG: hypothetical protein WD379_09080 [Dehalococcoidia bacterium]